MNTTKEHNSSSKDLFSDIIKNYEWFGVPDSILHERWIDFQLTNPLYHALVRSYSFGFYSIYAHSLIERNQLIALIGQINKILGERNATDNLSQFYSEMGLIPLKEITNIKNEDIISNEIPFLYHNILIQNKHEEEIEISYQNKDGENVETINLEANEFLFENKNQGSIISYHLTKDSVQKFLIVKNGFLIID